MAALDPSVASVSSITDAAAVVSTPTEESSGEAGPRTDSPPPLRGGIRSRVRAWIRTLHHDPSAEERAMQERRQQLLNELNRAVAEAPDDMPIREVIERLNHHRDD